eukprot:CAMPEP_0177783052 /NCGR_PEP_ID=MMETSP0491_2-20121128/18863_1 /TAXON_ID=63592 /ORGANISM="Tetraselmis chuii, Strain PLY429" /LENGTH=268 /DNA_ID=CAMNT_0019303529 /DNA_START=109 /DNA_END=911 /DNA_ORIENTATION=+
MPLLIVRHGERFDYVNRDWIPTSNRPWDPPLTETGKSQALQAGAAIQEALCAHGLPPITRAFSSPLVRCVETSLGILTATAPEVAVCVEPSLVETICKEWYHSYWGVPGANAEWGGPPGCRVGDHVSEEQLHRGALRPAGVLLRTAADHAEALRSTRLDTSYAAFLPNDALSQRWGSEEMEEDTMRRLGEFAEHCVRVFPGETVLLCTHGGPATMAYRVLSGDMDDTLKCGYTGIFLMMKEPSGWKTLMKASTDHIGDTKELGFATAG